MAKRRTDPKKRSSHDDPVVVDNGPLRVDFGKGHPPSADASGKKWTRECTPLHRLIVTTIRPFSEPDTETFLLDPAMPVTLHLEGTTGGTTKSSKMVVSTEGDRIAFTSKDFRHSLDHPTVPRFLRADASERPGISRITMRLSGDRQDTHFEPAGAPGLRALIVAFVPAPEKE